MGTAPLPVTADARGHVITERMWQRMDRFVARTVRDGDDEGVFEGDDE